MTYYPRAPITEAVIEVRFAEAIPKDIVDKVHSKMRDNYAMSDSYLMRNVQIDAASGLANVAQESIGFRLTSLDAAEICIVSSIQFTVSRLAPYTRWEDLYSRARRDWEVWKRAVGYRKIARLGVRYINRIDIPADGGGKILLEDYVTCYPEAPGIPSFAGLANYAMQLHIAPGPEGCQLIVNSSKVPSPLLNHLSLLLDLDVFKEGDVPQKDEEFWGLVARVRDYKNAIFESFVTDKARALFS